MRRSQWPRARKARLCGRSLARNAGPNPAGGLECLSHSSVVCCQAEVSASGWSLVQRSPTECGVYECNCEASIIRRPWRTRGCCTGGRGDIFQLVRLYVNFKTEILLLFCPILPNYIHNYRYVLWGTDLEAIRRGCECLPICVRLIMFGKLWAGNKERTSRSIPL